MDIRIKTIAVVVLFLFVLAQFAAPKLGLSVALNLDTSCYSGSFGLIERISPNSSCGFSGSATFGFPFALSPNYSALKNIIVYIANVFFFALFLAGVVLIIKLSRRKKPLNHLKVTR